MNREIDIPANGSVVSAPLGVFKYMAITSATVAFQISFDGSYWQTAKQNDRWDKSSQVPAPEKVYFMAAGGLASTVTISCDTKPLGNQDTAQSVVLNTALGCGGSKFAVTVKTAKLADGVTNYNPFGAAAVDLTKNNLLFIPGTNAGRKRKSIQFDVRNTNGNDICIFDAAGNLFSYLKGGNDDVIYETSSDFWVGGNANDYVGLIYNELFYERSNS